MPVAARRPKRVEYISWPDRTCWLEPGGGLHQLGDLIRPINMGRSPVERSMPQSIGCRDLMTAILGLHRQGEAPDREEAVAALGRRWRSRGPIEHAVDANELVPVALGEGHEVP